jgi:hypothetical protein
VTDTREPYWHKFTIRGWRQECWDTPLAKLREYEAALTQAAENIRAQGPRGADALRVTLVKRDIVELELERRGERPAWERTA